MKVSCSRELLLRLLTLIHETRKQNSILFDPNTGEIWDFKHQFTPLATDQMNDYAKLIGRQTKDGLYTAKSVSYLFPTQKLAELNRSQLVERGFNVFYIRPSGQTVIMVNLP